MIKKINSINILTLFILTTLLVSCTNEEKKENNEYIYWVNSYKVSCVGVAPMSCLLTQKGDTLEEHGWSNFYDNIEGFNYEPGNIYKLKVKEEARPKNEVAADASSIKYTLIEVLEKKQDMRLRLNDIWTLQEVYGKDIEKFKSSKELENKDPYIEINIAKNMINGFDGCNRINGMIASSTDKDLKFGNILVTRMLCKDMDLPTRYNDALKFVRHYKIENNKLYLQTKDGNTIMIFKKVD